MKVHRIHSVVAGALVVLAVVIHSAPPREVQPAPETLRPVQVEISADVPLMPDGFETRELRADVRERRGIYNVTPDFRAAVRNFEVTQKPGPKRASRRVRVPADPAIVDVFPANVSIAPAGPVPGEIVSFDSTNFGSNAAATGTFGIPADPQGAAGPNHVMTTTNTTAVVHDKTGNAIATVGLAGFFGALSPLTPTFDPRVIYDHHNQRWLLMTTEHTETVVGFPANTARIFIAVSDDADPLGSWDVLAIDAVTTFFNTQVGSTLPHWVDFPQIAVDEEAIYITGSMFAFFDRGGAFGGLRLWIIDKGEGTSGFYDGGTVRGRQYDPLPSPALVVGGTPAMVFGIPASASFGTYIVNYSGISDGVNEAVQVVHIDDPLGTPTFTPSLVVLGDIHDTAIDPPYMSPQSGTATNVTSNDSGALKAVWRGDNLWTAFSIRPPAGDPEVGQVVAHWVRLSVAATPVLGEQGRATGEDIAPGVHTFFPSLAVNSNLDVIIGFAASGNAIFPGAYYALHSAAGAPGSVGPSHTLMAGVDFYVRTLGASLNRWGDFSSVALDPVDDCFWIYNNYAMARGNVFDAGNGPESGQWATRMGKYCPPACSGTPDPVSNVRLAGANDTVLTWNDLGEDLTYDIVIGSLSAVRADGMVSAAGCLAQQTTDPTFSDVLPNPPAGEGRYYLLRGRSACANGDYGSDSHGVLRVPTPGCPE